MPHPIKTKYSKSAFDRSPTADTLDTPAKEHQQPKVFYLCALGGVNVQ